MKKQNNKQIQAAQDFLIAFREGYAKGVEHALQLLIEDGSNPRDMLLRFNEIVEQLFNAEVSRAQRDNAERDKGLN